MAQAEREHAFHSTLLTTERLPVSKFEAYQADLLARLFTFASRHSPWYRHRQLAEHAPAIGSVDWLQLPTVDRADLAAHGEAFRSTEVPAAHGPARALSSGGSTGAPVSSSVSSLDILGRVAVTYRLFSALGADQSRPLFMIRSRAYAARWTGERIFRKWGFPWLEESELGDRIHLDIDEPPVQQLDRLAEKAPAYVNTLPRNILGLGLASRKSGNAPSLPVLFAAAEYLAPEVAALAEERFGSHVIDILTSSEAGPIAIQCVESSLLHIQGERVLVEILDDAGRPCAAGETGEVVVTPFYNYAMPLIRYRTGDFAVAGGPCPCGRTLPTIERFAGRRESMFRYPDGIRRLPPIDRVAISECLGHIAWQLVQTAPHTAELRHEQATEGATPGAALEQVVDVLGPAWSVSLVETSVPMTGAGKRHYTLYVAG